MLGGENLQQGLDTEVKEEIKVSYVKVENIEKFKELTENIHSICKDKELLYLTFKIVDENVYSKSYIEKIFINLKHNNYVVELKKLYDDNKEDVVELLKNIFENEDIQKISHDVKIPHTILHKMGVDFVGVKFDTKIAAYLIDSSKGEYDLKTIIQNYLTIHVPGDGEESQVKETELLDKAFEALEIQIREGKYGRTFI